LRANFKGRFLKVAFATFGVDRIVEFGAKVGQLFIDCEKELVAFEAVVTVAKADGSFDRCLGAHAREHSVAGADRHLQLARWSRSVVQAKQAAWCVVLKGCMADLEQALPQKP
jgi:hypothetical protein